MIPYHQFVARHTHPGSPPLLPELRLHLAGEVDPLWRLLQRTSGDLDAPLPYWAVAWVGGQAVARYLLDHPGEVRGRCVLDFASGSGLCAIAAARSGARSVQAADIDPLARAAIALNAQLNAVEVEVVDVDLLATPPPAADVILGGDVCYEQPMAARALHWLTQAHATGARVLIGDPGRDHFVRDRLTCLADYGVPTTRELEGVEIRRSGVYTFR